MDTFGSADTDPLLPPSEMLSRFGARALDPATAAALPGQRLRPTAYIADQLLLRSAVEGMARDPVQRAAASLGLMVDWESVQRRESGSGYRLRLAPVDRPVAADAWRVLQEARAIARGLPGFTHDDALGVQLDP